MEETSFGPDEIERLIVALVEEFGDTEGMDGDIDLEANLLTSGMIDSIGIVRLIAELEQQLGVTVPPEDLIPENFRTVRVMTRFLASLSEGSLRSSA